MIPRVLMASNASSSRSQSVTAGHSPFSCSHSCVAASMAAATDDSSNSPGAYISSRKIAISRPLSWTPVRTATEISSKTSGSSGRSTFGGDCEFMGAEPRPLKNERMKDSTASRIMISVTTSGSAGNDDRHRFRNKYDQHRSAESHRSFQPGSLAHDH